MNIPSVADHATAQNWLPFLLNNLVAPEGTAQVCSYLLAQNMIPVHRGKSEKDHYRQLVGFLSSVKSPYHIISIDWLSVRAGMRLRSQGWGYVKGISTTLCQIQSRPGVTLLCRVRRSSPWLRRFPVPSFFSMRPRPLCMPMRVRRRC